MKKLFIVQKENEDLEKILFQGLNTNAYLSKSMNPMHSFKLCIEDETMTLFGGLIGLCFYGCLYIDMLWIDSTIRSLGYGRELMFEAEKIGQEHQCSFATVNTMDWEALPFYQKIGYSIEFVREGFQKESKMYLLRKNF